MLLFFFVVLVFGRYGLINEAISYTPYFGFRRPTGQSGSSCCWSILARCRAGEGGKGGKVSGRGREGTKSLRGGKWKVWPVTTPLLPAHHTHTPLSSTVARFFPPLQALWSRRGGGERSSRSKLHDSSQRKERLKREPRLPWHGEGNRKIGAVSKNLGKLHKRYFEDRVVQS